MARFLQASADQHVRQLYRGEAPSRHKGILRITYDIQPGLRIHKVRDLFSSIRTCKRESHLILDVHAHRQLEHSCLLATILSSHAEIRRVFKLSL